MKILLCTNSTFKYPTLQPTDKAHAKVRQLLAHVTGAQMICDIFYWKPRPSRQNGRWAKRISCLDSEFYRIDFLFIYYFMLFCMLLYRSFLSRLFFGTERGTIKVGAHWRRTAKQFEHCLSSCVLEGARFSFFFFLRERWRCRCLFFILFYFFAFGWAESDARFRWQEIELHEHAKLHHFGTTVNNFPFTWLASGGWSRACISGIGSQNICC